MEKTVPPTFRFPSGAVFQFPIRAIVAKILEKERIPLISVGADAPDFELTNQHRQPVRLSQFRGKHNVVIAFHPLSFTPVCSMQMQTYEKNLSQLRALDAHVLAISVDSDATKKGWSDALGGISYDLLGDFHPKGKVAASYGVMRDDGISERAVVVVDKQGVVVWTKKYDIPEQPDFGELLTELGKMSRK
jgi:peroxiredoxin